MAYMMDLAGFEVKDIHMTDLMNSVKILKMSTHRRSRRIFKF